MIELGVTIKLREPLLVGDIRPSVVGQIQETMRHIPGGVLRGAVGTRLARAGHHDQHADGLHADCLFCRVFLADSPPRFGPCYPVGNDLSESFPLPATARTCKHYPGFKIQARDAHGICDILLQQWAVESAFEDSGNLPDVYPFRCSECKAKLEPASGVYEQVDVNFFQPRVQVQRFSRVGIDRRRHVAADEMLYTLEVLSEEMDTGRRSNGRVKKAPTLFKGRVWVEAEPDLLANELRKIDLLGGNTARGLGAVSVNVDSLPPAPAAEPAEDEVHKLVTAVHSGDFEPAAKGNTPGLVARIARFNARLCQVARDVNAPVKEDVLFFCLDLLSDATWTDSGLPQASLPQNLFGAECVRAWTSAHVHGGWHTAAQIMRRTYLAIDAGSVFLYRLDNANDIATLRETLGALTQIERQGFGQERERGYGWIQVCSPFHLEVEPR